jgi:hypothetical protein
VSTGQASPLKKLEGNLGATWPTILVAGDNARARRDDLATELISKRLVPADAAVVVFGSLARGEWTEGSDVDWTLLVDGQVSNDHIEAVRNIEGLLIAEGLKKPGPTGTFAGMTFSHELVHRIGGDADTNQNITRRILLLLESTTLHSGSKVRERVIAALLKRYVGEDIKYRTLPQPIPRFLLNDVIRYWRTMCVDSAQKRRDRADGWALRNIKLRLSRKLIFTAGFWICLSSKLKPSAELVDAQKGSAEDFATALTEHLWSFVAAQRPLEVLANALTAYSASAPARATFDAYESFLALLDDPEKRAELEALKSEDAPKNETFRKAREIGREFQAGLTGFFFNTDATLTETAQEYGVF